MRPVPMGRAAVVGLALAAAGCGRAEPEDGPTPLPDVEFSTFDGEPAGFGDYPGKVLLVNFWASWCAPCEREIPQLKRYYGTLDRDLVEFLAISADETRGAAIEFIEPFDVPFPTFFGGSGMQEHFGYYGLPYTLVVDPDGMIVEEVLGFGTLENWEHLKRTLEAEIARAAEEARRDSPAGFQEAAESPGHL